MYRRSQLAAVVAAAVVLLSACAHREPERSAPDQASQAATVSETAEVAGSGSAIDRATMDPVAGSGDAKEGGAYFVGSGRFVNAQPKGRAGGADIGPDGVTLNFVDADIARVAEAVLGTTLGLDYVIAPEVTGRVTLRSRTPVPKPHVLAALEQAFQLSGIALIERQDAWHIVSLAEAKRSASSFSLLKEGRALRPGYGVHIVPLKYIAASELEKVVGPLLPPGSLLSTDDARNLIVLGGTSGEVKAALEAVDLFDVNWLSAMSFALLTPKFASAEDIAEELATIFDHADNPMAGRVELMPLARINAILVMTAEPQFIKEVEQWITRLDRRGDGEEPQIFVYNVQHGTAEDITASLISILSGSGNEHGASGSEGETQSYGTGGAQEITIGSSKGVKIVANQTNNAIMVYSGGREYKMILDAIRQIDVPVDQVLIEATIAEVTLNDELKYGVQWFFDNAESSFTESSNSGGAVTSQFPGFSYTYFTTSAQVALNALESLTDVKVLSSPKLMMLNNQSAMLQVGDQVPVASQSAVSITDSNAPIVNAVQFRDTGVILEVTPRINTGGMVLMEVSQEVSDVIPTTTSGIDSPTIQQRKINSTVTVEDGETIALGGLIRETESRGKSGLPFLSRIPVVGAAFGAQDKTNRRTELLIFITPRVIRNTEDANAATEYLRSNLKHSKFFDKTR